MAVEARLAIIPPRQAILLEHGLKSRHQARCDTRMVPRGAMDEPTGPAQPAERPRRPRIAAFGAVAVAVVVLVVVQLFHVLDGFDAALVEMGFDSDRARF